MLTRSEIFAYAKKATRGAGFSWGMAEEAAQATVALYVAGHDGFAALVPVLQNADGKTQPLSDACGLTSGHVFGGLWIAPSGQDVIGANIIQARCVGYCQGR